VTDDSADDVIRDAYRWFERWLDADDARRDALIESIRGNAPIYTRLTALIRADAVAEQAAFMTGRVADAAIFSETSPTTDRSGQHVGNWELQRLLGSGGMGQVWHARRSDGLHLGQAAIKMLRIATSDTRANERFAQEGRILARLVHPHIAMLLDAGVTENGERYLVIEYVAGERIDRWCDQRHLSIDGRLKLFLQVCDALNYAHANLVIHRDLKPSNILVIDNGDAKLLDFGIAKLLEDDTTSANPLTSELGAAMTPAYAAPEQINGAAITTATDVYALGAVLHQLLGGHGPYDMTLTPLRLARSVVESEPRRLSELGKPESARANAAARGTTPDRLWRMLRGDLETIVGKALKKNPADRYANVQALIDDLRRHLDHLPIAARADSAIYRIGRFVRRHGIGVAAAAAVFVAIAIGLGVSLSQADRAEHEAARAIEVKRFLVGLFDASRNTSAGIESRQRTVGDLLESGASRLETELRGAPDVRDEVYTTLVEIFDSAGEQDRSLAMAKERVSAAESSFGSNDIHVASAVTLLAGVQMNRGDMKAAAPLLDRSERILNSRGDQTSLERARLWLWQGMYGLMNDDSPRFADTPFVKALDLLRNSYPNEDDLEVALSGYIVLAGRTEHFDVAEAGAQEMRQRAVARYGEDSTYVANADLTLATALARNHKFALSLARATDARDRLIKFEGYDHPDVMFSEATVIDALLALGDSQSARKEYARFTTSLPSIQNIKAKQGLSEMADKLH
jgi:serine/threonine-protein kinase